MHITLLDFGPMESPAELVLASAALGQAFLVAALLLVRSKERPVYVPLAGFFGALFIIALQPVAATLYPSLTAASVGLLLPAYLSLGPLFWLYVVGLTQETPWLPTRRDLSHFLPMGIAAATVGLGGVFPEGTLDSLIVSGDDQAIYADGDKSRLTFAGYLVLLAFGLLLFWLVQSAYYMFRILRRLIGYRRALKELFASNERRELGWIIGVLVTTGCIWLVTVVALLLENFADLTLLGVTTRSAILLVLISLLALWGLRQKPGFDDRYLSPEQAEEVRKYERSALDEEHSLRIATKLQNAMLKDKLYLRPGLSLTSLAEHLGIPANYISQTLNETLQLSFFDYVNGHRIEAAKPMVVEGNDAILDIAYAVGFNARSSFYNAFKRVTGKTPGQYRKISQERFDRTSAN